MDIVDLTAPDLWERLGTVSPERPDGETFAASDALRRAYQEHLRPFDGWPAHSWS